MDERVLNLKNEIINEIIDLVVEKSDNTCEIDFNLLEFIKAFPTKEEDGYYLAKLVTDGRKLWVYTLNPETMDEHYYDARVVDIEDLVYNIKNALIELI